MLRGLIAEAQWRSVAGWTAGGIFSVEIHDWRDERLWEVEEGGEVGGRRGITTF